MKFAYACICQRLPGPPTTGSNLIAPGLVSARVDNSGRKQPQCQQVEGFFKPGSFFPENTSNSRRCSPKCWSPARMDRSTPASSVSQLLPATRPYDDAHLCGEREFWRNGKSGHSDDGFPDLRTTGEARGLSYGNAFAMFEVSTGGFERSHNVGDLQWTGKESRSNCRISGRRGVSYGADSTIAGARLDM